MELSKKLEKALNDQLNEELYSAYLYLAMSAYFEAEGLPGMAQWMRAQAKEEVGHAMKFFDYINERNGRVILQAVKNPPAEWKGVKDVFEQALKHEQHISQRIYDLMDLAHKEKDHATHEFLEWFVEEQVEEEKSVQDVLDKIKLVQDSPTGFYLLDQELGERKE